MMMITDIKSCTVPFDVMSSDLQKLGESIGVQVKCQREDIFDKMHRI
jgi:ACT domain-containing protein